MAVFFLLSGCAGTDSMTSRHQQLILTLEREMRTNTGWVRIHAADALADHGETQTVFSLFAGSVDVPSPYQIGVWRVMARVSPRAAGRETFIVRLRAVMLDPQAPAADRLRATESLAKLGVARVADREVLEDWATKADDASAAMVRWQLVLSSPATDREADEASLSALLDSPDAIARLRAAFALGKLESLSEESLARLRDREEREPADSQARAYLITANLRHAGHDPEFARKLKSELYPYFAHGTPAEQLEAGTVLGLCSDEEDRADENALNALLTNPQADARIGAASGLLYLGQKTIFHHDLSESLK
jgi:hypothetical protein